MNALITGSTRGIGRAIARRFAAAGFNLFITSKMQENVKRTCEELRNDFPEIEILSGVFNLSKEDEVEALSSLVQSKWNKLDVLVNNAGVFLGGSVLGEKNGRLEYLLNTNLLSAYRLTRSLKELFIRQKRGYIFNMCSIASLDYYPNGGSYGISKAAMLAMSKAFRAEFMPHHVRVSSVMPGAVFTDSWPDTGLPKSRFIHPEDIANLIYHAWEMPANTVVENILIRPLEGDL